MHPLPPTLPNASELEQKLINFDCCNMKLNTKYTRLQCKHVPINLAAILLYLNKMNCKLQK